ncbi:MAG TPA: hypothetical protein VGA56_06130 [Opitutaceae bacterium]
MYIAGREKFSGPNPWGRLASLVIGAVCTPFTVAVHVVGFHVGLPASRHGVI